MSNKTLAILHVSPPVHGAAAIGDFIVGSKTIVGKLDLLVIPIASARSIEDIGSFRVRKILATFSLTVRVLFFLCWHRMRV